MDVKKPEYRYSQIRPTRAVTDFTSGSTIDFDYRSVADELVNLRESHFTLRVTATKSTDWNFEGSSCGATGVNASAAIQHDSIAQNPMSCFFQNCVLSVNDREISRLSDVQGATTALKLCYDDREEHRDSLSKIIPYSYIPVFTDYDVPNNFSNARFNFHTTTTSAVSDKTYAGKQRVIAHCNRINDATPEFGFVTGPTLEFLFGMPFYMFLQLQAEPLPGNSKIRTQFTIDSQNLSKFLFSLIPGVTITNLTVNDFYMNVAHTRSLSGPPVSLKWESDYIETHTNISDNNNSALQLTANSPSVKAVIVSYLSKTVSPLVLRNQHEGIFGQATPATNYFRNIYISFSGRTYPNPQYTFPEDYARAYLDYKTFTMANSSGSMLSYKEWLQSPFFVFYCEGMPENSDRQLTVFTVSAGTVNTNYQVCVNILYKKTLSIEYDEFAQPVNTVVSDSQ